MATNITGAGNFRGFSGTRSSKALGGAGSSYNETTGALTIPTLSLNQGASLQITATVLVRGNYTNTATKTASTPADPTPGNDSASATTTPVSTADIQVTKTVNNATPNVAARR